MTMTTARVRPPGQDLTPNPRPPHMERGFVVKDHPEFKHLHCTNIHVTKTRQYATWFGGTAEGAPDIKVWISTRTNDKDQWSDPKILVGKDGLVHWNPVAFPPDRENQPDWLIVYYKIDTPIPVWRTYWVETRDGGKTWTEPKELVPGDRTGGRGPQKNPPIVLTNGDWIAGSSYEVTNPPGSAAYGKWDSFAELAPKPGPNDTFKQGELWIKSDLIELPADRGDPNGSFPGEGIIQPSVYQNPKTGKISMFTRSSNGRVQRTDSTDGGRTWTPAYDTPLYSNNSGQCVCRLRDGRLVFGQNPIEKSWGPRTPLILSISSDEGETWKHWITLEDAPPAADFERIVALESGIVSDGRSEFSYPCLTPTLSDDVDGVYVSYTWQRRGVVVAKVWDE